MKGSEQATENPGQMEETLGNTLQEGSGAKATRSSFGPFYKEGRLAFTELLLYVRCHARYFTSIVYSSL